VGGTHSFFSFGQSAAAGSAPSSELDADLRATSAAAPGGSGPHPTARRSGRARQPCARVARPMADDRRHRRRRIQSRAAPAERAARKRTQQQRSAGIAANAHGGGGGGRRTHRVSKSLHWPSHSGSAFTFVPEMDLPRTARACGRARRATMGGRGVERAEAMQRRPRMHPRTPAFT
jgi:hypothetical protein